MSVVCGLWEKVLQVILRLPKSSTELSSTDWAQLCIWPQKVEWGCRGWGWEPSWQFHEAGGLVIL